MIFSALVIVKCMEKNLVLVNVFGQSFGPSLNRGFTALVILRGSSRVPAPLTFVVGQERVTNP